MAQIVLPSHRAPLNAGQLAATVPALSIAQQAQKIRCHLQSTAFCRAPYLRDAIHEQIARCIAITRAEVPDAVAEALFGAYSHTRYLKRQNFFSFEMQRERHADRSSTCFGK
jgi:hypothetical protein